MTNSSIIVWPRHEIIQLINPSLSQSGRHLTNSLIVEASRHLAKLQSLDNSLSFEQWYSVASDFLKWNDYCIRLFWDLLHIATWYTHRNEWCQHSDYVHSGYLIIFLVLHSSASMRPTSPPRQSYDDIWPSDNNVSNQPSINKTSSSSPPSSPSKSIRKGFGAGSSQTPLSPRGSPRVKRGGGIKSPSSYYKSSTQHLSFIKEKLPTIIHALSLQDSGTAEHDIGNNANSINGGVLSLGIGLNWIDSLLFILGCGFDEKIESNSLSSLIPGLSGSIDEGVHGAYQDDLLRSGKPSSTTDEIVTSLPCGDVIEWIENHLRLNESKYPPCPISSSNSFLSPSSSSVLSQKLSPIDGENMTLEGDIPVDFNSGLHIPVRQTIALSSPQAKEPLVVNGTANTFIHLLTIDSSNDNSIPKPARLRNLSGDASTPPGGANSPDGLGITSSMEDLSEMKGQIKESNSKLINDSPVGPGLIHGCVRMTIYLLGTFSCLTITSCVDCEIVVGAVSGVILMSSCERVHLTATCRKLIIWNSNDSDFRIATLTPSIVSGDCRGLVFGPFNTAYRLLRSHLRLANLDNLITSSHISIGTNYWSDVYDVTTCLDAPPPISPPSSAPSSPRSSLHSQNMSSGSNTFLSIGGSNYGSGLSSGLSSLPKAPESVLTLLNPEKYSFLSIPYPSEYQPQEMSPILTPERYAEAYMRKKQLQSELQRLIRSAGVKSSSGDVDEAIPKHITQYFLEWIVKTGKSQQLLDLVRLDTESEQRSGIETSTNESGSVSREVGGIEANNGSNSSVSSSLPSDSRIKSLLTNNW